LLFVISTIPKPIGIIKIILKDDTGRWSMAKTDHSKTSFQHFPANNPNPVFMVVNRKTVLYANSAARRLMVKCTDKRCNELPDAFDTPVSRVLKLKKKVRFEIEVRNKTFLFDAVPDLNKGRIYFYGTDISDRKKIEQKLRENQSRFALAQKAADVGAWDWEVKTGRIIWRYHLEPVFGLKRGKRFYKFKDIMNLVHPEDRERILQILDDCFRTKGHYDFEHRLIWPDGSIHWLRQVGRSFMTLPDGPERMIGIVLDVTNRILARLRLESEKTDLESIIKERTQELAQTNVYLQNEIRGRENYQNKLRLLSSELALSEEKQRRQIASNLHDDIIQTLVYSNMRLGNLIEKNGNQDIDSLQYIYGLVDQVVEKLRRVTHEISPPILYEFGLIAAVEWLRTQYQKQYGFKIKIEAEENSIELDEEIRLVLYQAIRELLNNTAKHAKATLVQIVFNVIGQDLFIRYSDNGKGFNTHRLDKRLDNLRGFGIFNIKDRISYLDGEFEMTSEPGEGVTVHIQAPRKKGG
jgi:signal transduction histidine kinase